MWNPAQKLSITEDERKTLKAWVAAKTSPQRTVLRARICLLAADGLPNRAIAKALKTSRPTVVQWRKRFEERGPQGLAEDAPHGLSSRALPAEKIKAIVEATLHTTPPDATHWSTRTMAQAMGVSNATVSRIWDAHGLQPHRVEGFKLSKDKRFVEKLTDVVGVYLNPPDKAVVLCVDEKSQVQALERAQPILPLRPGIPERQTHDYERHGVTNLYAALNVASGQVIGACADRHCAEDYIAFLKLVDQNTPRGKMLHLIVDNASSHDTKAVRDYLAKRPKRFEVHHTPTHSSWLNLVERWFSEITTKRIRRGSFASVKELERAIMDYIHHWNESGRLFVWTKSSKQILRNVRKAAQN